MTALPRRFRLPRPIEEVLRLLLLVLAGCWLALPFRTDSLVGGGDAVWYHHQVADAVTQFRAGVFPVYVGQTHAAFNGAVHPIRTAPALPYLAGLLDLLTGRQLGFHTLLHLSAAVSLIVGLLVTYGALVWMAPHARWRAALLSWLFVSAPGVLGLPYAQDLYMSTMAIPWVPLVFAGAVQAVRGTGWYAGMILGGAVGILWWAHSPIALWTTAAVGLVILLSAFTWGRDRTHLMIVLRAGVIAGGTLLAVAAYPVASVLLLRASGEAIVPRPLVRADLLNEIAQAFPAIVQPLDLQRPLLTFIQPGYAILGALLCAAVGAWRASGAVRTILGALLAVALLALVLILPVPGITTWLWLQMPDMWANMTNIWPMQRVCIVIAAVAVVALQLVPPRSEAVAGRRVWPVVLGAVALLWSVSEADVVRSLAVQRTRPADERERLAREENINVSEYCYQQLSGRPAYFIHGVTDPHMELRLLDPDTGEILISNKRAVEEAATDDWQELRIRSSSRTDLVEFEPKFTLEPGRRYLLTFAFGSDVPTGVLRLVGTSLERVYVLPSAGEAKGFGAGPDQEKSLVLWTTRDAPEEISLQFLPQAGSGARLSLGKVRLTEIRPETLPVQVRGLLPLEATVRTERPVLLETMRMAIPGWYAEVEGRPVAVQRSAEGLVMFPVPAGEHEVTVRYVGPRLLPVAFWVSVIGLVGLAFGMFWSFRKRKALDPESTGLAV